MMMADPAIRMISGTAIIEDCLLAVLRHWDESAEPRSP